MLVATRLIYSMARDNMLPGSRQLAIVKPGHKSPIFAVIAATAVSLLILLSALYSSTAFAYILGMSSLGYFGVYVFTTAGLIYSDRKGNLPATEPGLFDLGRKRRPLHILGLIVFSATLLALLLLPDFRKNGYVYLGSIALCGVWYLTVLRGRLARHEAGPSFVSNRVEVEVGSTRA
jgi:amino acid transporter